MFNTTCLSICNSYYDEFISNIDEYKYKHKFAWECVRLLSIKAFIIEWNMPKILCYINPGNPISKETNKKINLNHHYPPYSIDKVNLEYFEHNFHCMAK